MRIERPIVVLRIIDRLNVGGPALHAILTSAYLDRGRFRTILVYGAIEPQEGDMSYLLDRHDVEAIHLPELSRELRPLRDLRAFVRLYRLMRRQRPHVVHTHKSKAGLLGRLAALAAGVPVRLHTYHGHVLSGYFRRGRTDALILLERFLAHTTTRLITVSEELLRDLSGNFHIAPPERFCVIPLGLDLAGFRHAERAPGAGGLRRELGLPESARLVGLVGRMVPIKDHALFLRAFAALGARPQLHAVLVGGGELEAELRAETARLGGASRVHFLGWRQDLPAIYADLDVLALTSRNEGTPVAVIEALCAGVPVVASAVGGVADVLDGGRCGTLVRGRDPHNFARALAAALDDPEVRSRAKSPERRDEALRRYGIERLCRDLAELYRDEIGRALSGPRSSSWSSTLSNETGTSNVSKERTDICAI